MKLRTYLMICIWVFAMVCIGHLIRVLYRLDLDIGPYSLPMWASVIAVVITAALAGLGVGFYRTRQ